MKTGELKVSFRKRFLHYASKITGGYIRPGQLANLARERLMPRAEVVSWQPITISFWVTSRCNFRCDMCPTHSLKIPKSYIHRHHEVPDMSPELLRFVLDRYPCTLRVSLIGVGEPLLNPCFFELVRECDKRRLIVDMVSNGYALEGHIPDIVRSGLNGVTVSVNGHTPEEFHRMTGMRAECHSQILRNVQGLVRARRKRIHPRIGISFILDSHNWQYSRQMIEMGEEVGADFVVFFNFLPAPYAGFMPEERCLYADDPAVRDEFAWIMSQKFRCDVKWPYLLGQPGNNKRVCECPFNMLLVDGAGNVGGCHAMILNMHENGTVYDKDPWNNECFRDLRRRHLQGDLFWPCNYCVSNGGVNPSRFVKSKLPLRLSQGGGTENIVLRNEKEV